MSAFRRSRNRISSPATSSPASTMSSFDRLVEEEYLERFFGHCERHRKLRAEGSVTYLYAPERMAPILKLWPDAKFVIALRDPLSMLPSLHAAAAGHRRRDYPRFPKAWAKIDERAQGKSIPRAAIDPRWLRYDEAGALGRHVERFLAAVGRERCHIILFDDLAGRSARAPTADLCGFLGLEPWPGTNFEAAADQQDDPHRLASAPAQAPAQGGPHRAGGRKIPHAREEARRRARAGASPPSSPCASGCSNGTRCRPSASRSIPASASRSSTGCATTSSCCRR